MASAQTALVKKYLILVEGSSDKAFLDALIAHYAMADFQVIAPADVGPSLGGAAAFKQVLDSLFIRDGFSGVAGILLVSDNDNDPSLSFGNVSQAINNAEPFDDPSRKFLAPTKPEAKSASQPPIVVLMLPEPGVPGNLETLCIASATKTTPKLVGCVGDLVRCAGISGWSVPKRDKARVRSLIAVAHEQRPDISLPDVWRDAPHLFHVGSPAFERIVKFLQQLPAILA